MAEMVTKAIRRRAFAASLGAMITAPARAQAPLPAPPCGAASVPDYSRTGAPPAIASWRRSDLKSWQPAPCLGWSGSSRSAAALAATFRFAGTEDDLLVRIGNLALHPTIKYWSASREEWRPLVVSAEVVDGIEGKAIATAFPPSAFVAEVTSFYAETTLDTGRTVYRLKTLARSPGRIVLATDNATPIRILGVTLFEPGTLQAVTFLQGRDNDLWAYYAITRVSGRTSFLAEQGEASYINRLVALYRYTAGLETDAEPPARR
jgi:hypothetical protein